MEKGGERKIIQELQTGILNKIIVLREQFSIAKQGWTGVAQSEDTRCRKKKVTNQEPYFFANDQKEVGEEESERFQSYREQTLHCSEMKYK